MSLTLRTKGARFMREYTSAARPTGSGGDSTTITSVRPAAGSAVRLVATNERWLAILFAKPAFGVAYTHLRSTRTPSIHSSIAVRQRYASRPTPVGQVGTAVTTVTSSPG